MSVENYSVGDIVTLKTHPYSFTVNKEIIIKGDSTLIPPFMVVVETLNDQKKSYDEHTGEENSETSQNKCIWYSTKSNQFEEQWIFSKFLKKIDYLSKEVQGTEIRPNTLVCLKTTELEYGKLKSSVHYEGDLSEIRSLITPLLSFVSPVMQVIEIKKNEDKDPKYDPKTGVQKRFSSKKMVKCKWYNSFSDKMSEKILPIDALELIHEISDKGLMDIVAAKNKYFAYKSTMIKILQLLNRSGKYYIKYYDLVASSEKEIIYNPNLLDNIVETPFLDAAPKYENLINVNEDANLQEIVALIVDAKKTEHYIQIKYKNINDKISIRTLSDYEIIRHSNNKDIFLSGYCNLKESKRNFNISRIQKIKKLNLVMPQTLPG